MTLDQVKANYQNIEHLGDGAYIAKNDYEIILFTSNGVTITRPVALDAYGVKALENYLKGQNHEN